MRSTISHLPDRQSLALKAHAGGSPFHFSFPFREAEDKPNPRLKGKETMALYIYPRLNSRTGLFPYGGDVNTKRLSLAQKIQEGEVQFPVPNSVPLEYERAASVRLYVISRGELIGSRFIVSIRLDSDIVPVVTFEGFQVRLRSVEGDYSEVERLDQSGGVTFFVPRPGRYIMSVHDPYTSVH